MVWYKLISEKRSSTSEATSRNAFSLGLDLVSMSISWGERSHFFCWMSILQCIVLLYVLVLCTLR